MRKSAKTALGGIIAALSVVLMLLSSVIPFMQYALPAIAGTLMIIMVIEVGKGWAFAAYSSVSFLSLILLADKEAAMMYVAFFGWYPILKPIIESRIKLRFIQWILKFLSFNTALISAYFFLFSVFGLKPEDLTEHGIPGLIALLAAGNVMFIIFDIFITRIVFTYQTRWQSTFRNIFK